MNSQILISGLASGMVYALMGLGLVLLYKGTRVLNFAHGEIGLVSAYVCYWLAVTVGMPMWVCAIAALLTGALLSVVIERTIIRPLGPHNMLAKMIASLGIFLALSVSIGWIWFTDPRTMPGLFPDESVTILGAAVPVAAIGVLVASVLALAALIAFFGYHPLGLVVRASADNAAGAALVGIRPDLVSATLWAMTGAIAALAAIMILPLSFIATGVMTPILLKGMAAAVVGGFESLPGVVVGGLVIGVSENILAFTVSPAWKTPFAFCVLFAILMVAPRGIFAGRQVARV